MNIILGLKKIFNKVKELNTEIEYCYSKMYKIEENDINRRK